MTKLSPEICYEIKAARKAAKLSQSELASEVGCKQSALSMFEQGDGTKLNDDVVKKLATKFGVDIEKKQAPKASAVEKPFSVPPQFSSAPAKGFCPNPRCPTNHEFEVEGHIRLIPARAEADPVGGRYCAMCGEILEKHCPNCGAAVHDGAFCSLCGTAYVAVAE